MLPLHQIKKKKLNKSLSVLNCNFSKEQSMLPEDDSMIETCRSVLSVLMWILGYERLYMCICWCVT